jgi:hypothetical protein
VIDTRKFREACGDGKDEDQLLWAVKRDLDPECPGFLFAQGLVFQLVRDLLDAQEYGEAATILWGERLFDSRPVVVQMIFDFIFKTAKGIVLGASAQGKSYNASAWLLLDWIRDPQYTCCKVLSTTAGHAKANVFATLHRLHAGALVPLPGYRLDGFIGLDSKDPYAGIERVSIKIGEEGAGALRGFHPIPRKERHPIFGWQSRVRGLLDEAEDIPEGVWSSVDNLLSSKEGSEMIKIIAAANPKRVTSTLAAKAEPKEGWNRVEIDEDFLWKSREGWDVLRLDGAITENVVQQEVIYPNFMTYEGYLNLVLKGGGESADYYTFARGMYPMKGVETGAFPIALFDMAQGSYIFSSFSVNAMGIDMAWTGGDKVIAAIGRYGEVIGFTHYPSGKVIHFEDEKGKPISFWAAQLDQMLELEKMLALAQARNIMRICTDLNILPEWVMLDKSSNGVYDNLREIWSPKVQGVGFGEIASQKKIYDTATAMPFEIYENVATEMHHALADWLEYQYFKIGPHADLSVLQRQLTRRKVINSGVGPTGRQRKRLEKKEDYKKRYAGNESPDHADASCLFLHVCRMNGKEKANALSRRRTYAPPKLSEADKFNWLHPDSGREAA